MPLFASTAPLLPAALALLLAACTPPPSPQVHNEVQDAAAQIRRELSPACTPRQIEVLIDLVTLYGMFEAEEVPEGRREALLARAAALERQVEDFSRPCTARIARWQRTGIP